MRSKNVEATHDAEMRRKHKAMIEAHAKRHYDTDNSQFLPAITHMALQDDAPAHLLIALCQYVAKKDAEEGKNK
jgi:hypothetical protein